MATWRSFTESEATRIPLLTTKGNTVNSANAHRNRKRATMQTSRKTLYFSFIGILLAVFCLNCGVKYPKKKVETSELAIHHNNRGVVYLKQGDLERAEWEFRTSAEISKKYADPHNNLGLVYKYRGEYPQALQSFRNAMKADAKWAAPYNHVGATYLAMGNIGQAVVYIKRAIAIDKKYGEAYYNLGLCYLARGREKADGGKVDSAYLHQAVKYLKKATDADVNIYHAHLELGDIYRDLGEWENAIVRYRVAIETNPTSPIPWGRFITRWAILPRPSRALPKPWPVIPPMNIMCKSVRPFSSKVFLKRPWRNFSKRRRKIRKMAMPFLTWDLR